VVGGCRKREREKRNRYFFLSSTNERNKIEEEKSGNC